MIIRYNKTMTVRTDRNGELEITTDLGQTWKTVCINSSTPLTEWWMRSNKSNLAQWQKDMVQVVVDGFVNHLPEQGNSYQIYHVYQKGQGYASTSDVLLMRIPQASVWFVATSEDSWLFEDRYGNFSLKTVDSIGSILEQNVRRAYYDWSDQARGVNSTGVPYTDQDYVNKGIAP